MIRQKWIGQSEASGKAAGKATKEAVSVARQCVLAGVSRATVYAQRKPKLEEPSELLHKKLIDQEYTRHPFYGSRRMVIVLKRAGHTVNRKRVQRLMRQMGLAGMAPGAQLADQQQHGDGILRRLPGRCPAHLRQTGNLQ